MRKVWLFNGFKLIPRNHAWNETQGTYRQNYQFNRTKNDLVRQVHIGVQSLELEYNSNKDTYGSWSYNIGQHGRNLLGGWFPFSSNYSFNKK